MQCTFTSVLNHVHLVPYFLSRIAEECVHCENVCLLTFASGWLAVWPVFGVFEARRV